MCSYLVPYPSRGLTSSLEVVLRTDLDPPLLLPTEYPGFFSHVVFARVSPPSPRPKLVLIKAFPGGCVWCKPVDPKGLGGTLALMASSPSYNRSLFYTILHPKFSVRTLPGPETCPPILSMHGVTTCVGCSMVSQLQLPSQATRGISSYYHSAHRRVRQSCARHMRALDHVYISSCSYRSRRYQE